MKTTGDTPWELRCAASPVTAQLALSARPCLPQTRQDHRSLSLGCEWFHILDTFWSYQTCIAARSINIGYAIAIKMYARIGSR
eukprot:1678785-Pyramimonas_sp.AAC.1